MNSINRLKVFLNFSDNKILVGELGIKGRQILFEYNQEFIKSRLEISPFKLPLKAGVFEGNPALFDGLFGVFNDSLPDGWGRLLLDRKLREQGLNPDTLNPLDRLAFIGNNALGALSYEPDNSLRDTTFKVDLDEISKSTQEILSGDSEVVLDELIKLNGSSNGARPKINVGVSKDKKKITSFAEASKTDEFWLIKFANSNDVKDVANVEYAYSLMAKAAGIDMPKTHLFISKKGKAFFGIERFDVNYGKRLHMHSLSGLINSDFRIPSLDYTDLLKATLNLTRDVREVEKIFKLAVFNVLAHNQDDHAKNFSFLMNEKGEWQTSPAYDLTFSTGVGNEQSMMVLGKGKNIGLNDLLELGKFTALKPAEIKNIIDKVQSAVSKWNEFADKAHVSSKTINFVKKYLKV
jgi:serine/threonine-protein kinase HipA